MAKTATKEGICWRSWGSAAFEEARRSGKLILLDSGASWCHWCHVMDHQTYEDGEVIALINERFIPVRIDRDRLPDVDARFQSSVPIITSQGGGWPLTVLVTPEGHALYKTTYLPPRADEGIGASMGLIELLEVLERHWRENRQAIADAAERLSEGLLQERRQIYCQAGKLTDDLVDTIFAGLERAYDSQHGGFGDAPKFFNAPALELLETLAWRGNARARDMLVKTLQSIARGGVYDHVGGGFHRYSLDARWHVPHFEKMAADNAALLAIYANAYALTGLKDFQQVAMETRDWIDHVLGGSKREGFYASQDADAGPGDDGDYFTWTAEEFRAATGELADVAMDYYDIDAQGDMPDRPGRNVLHIVKPPDVQARLQNISPQELTARIEQARHYLRSARANRRSPAADRTAFADVNGMMIDAYLTCYERLDDAGAGEIAFATLDHLLAVLRDDRGVFAHYRQDGILENAGLLADQAWMARALVHAFAASAKREYLDAAAILADYIIGELASEYGGFAAARPQGRLAGKRAAFGRMGRFRRKERRVRDGVGTCRPRAPGRTAGFFRRSRQGDGELRGWS